MNPVISYLLIINAVGFLLMLIDKYKAQNNLWRIPESALMGTAILGGSLGCIIGMYTVRHKTRHLKFKIGLPCLLAVQIIISIFLFQS